MEKIAVGVIGATGIIGQNYIRLLDKHPWFEVKYVAASPRSTGKKYQDAVEGRWYMDGDIPENVKDMIIEDANMAERARGRCAFVFSALKMEKNDIIKLENSYAKADIPVVSNNSAHRHTSDVPVLIPEINHSHLDIIKYQQENNGWQKGFVVVKPNCSVQSYLIPIYAVMKAGYEIRKMMITTFQAVSGAGYPGVASLDVIDNMYPLPGEEIKAEKEPLKIFGELRNGKIENYGLLKISAHCNRVPVIDGHTACVSLEFGERKPEPDEIITIWKGFRSVPQELNLPFAPSNPVVYRPESDRPQPRKDRDGGKGMAISTGRLRKCNVLDYRFIGLSHNTIRGAAGGGILNAELLKAKGFFD
jgi:aspartate-semialdehyde dehydrogenase